MATKRFITGLASIVAFGFAPATYSQAPASGSTSAPRVSSSATTSSAVSSAPLPGDENEITDTSWKFVTRLSANATYDDNIFIQPRNQKEDVYFHVAPSLAMGIGTFRDEIAPFAAIPHVLAFTGEEDLPAKDFAYASYTPDAVIFSKHTDENTLNHDLRFAARRQRELWNLQGQLRFESMEDANIEAGRRLRQMYYTADGSAWHALTGKTSGMVGFRGQHADYPDGFASTDLRGTAAFEYQLAPKTAIGGGASAGYLDVARGGNQTYHQPFFQVRYDPTGKMSFTGRAGAEFRQFDSRAPDRSRFVYSLMGTYEPSDGLSASFTGRRETLGSAQYADQNVISDTLQGSVRQRILTRLYLGLAGGYVRNRYENNQINAAGLPRLRRDEFYYGRVSASRDITTHGTIELSYEHRENDSTFSNFGFAQNVASLGASFMF